MNVPLTAYRAKWIVPGNAPPLEGGAVVIAGDRIAGVEAQPRADAVDLGDVAVIPGLVNAHTHLEFSDLPQPFDTRRPFTAWLKDVIAYRRGHASQTSAAIQAGLRESLQHGTTLLGDIATRDWSRADYDAVPQRPGLVVFQELLSLSPSRVPELTELARTHLASTADATWTPGVSPHTPYTVHPDLLRAALDLNAPTAMHLAETSAEVELLERGSGEFRTFLEELGLWPENVFGGRTMREELEALSDLPRGLVIHGNHLTLSDLGFLAGRPHLTLVYCPRTHAAFGHPPHPWLKLLHLGGSLAIGTDSRASNPDLSLFRELQFLAENAPQMPHHELLKLGTLNGARALGQAAQAGTLTIGKRADLAVVELADPAFRDPNYDLFAPGNRVIGTMVRGKWAVEPRR